MSFLSRLAPIVLVPALVWTSAPAGAATFTVRDRGADAVSVAAPLDLRQVTWDYTADDLVATVRLARVRKRDAVVRLEAAHDVEGYEVELRTRWRHGTKVDRLWIWYNTVSRTPVECPGLTSRWRVGEGGFVRVRVPNACLFDGYPLRDLQVTTQRPGSRTAADGIAAARRLTSG